MLFNHRILNHAKSSPLLLSERFAFCGILLIAALVTTGAHAQSTINAASDPAQAPKTSDATSSNNPREFIEEPVSSSEPAQPAQSAAATNPFGFLSTASHSSNLLGDMWGLRPALSNYGMTLSVVEQSEALGNLTGGVRQGFDYDGLTTMTLQMDTQRAFGWNGGLFNVSGLQIHGNNLSAENLMSLQTASGIEADRTTRLWELWYQQKFLDDKLDVKIGQQSLDQEFMVSQNAGYFVNTMFGWPMLPSADMPAGGPAYPLSALGVRTRLYVNDSVTLLAGVYNGSPVLDNSAPDPQVNNCCGVSFPLNGGALAIAELQYSYPAAGAVVHTSGADSLAGTYKIGVWYDTESFADQRLDNIGLSLANPASTGVALTHRGDYGFYAVADQMIYRSKDDPDQTFNIFVRPMIAPEQDRNLISFSINAGLTVHEPLPGRSNDIFGIGMGSTRVSNAASGFDEDFEFYNPGVYWPVRRWETFIEATYQYQVMPWWQIQPDIQYVINPGAGIVNPNDPTQSIKNELVTGVRTTITF